MPLDGNAIYGYSTLVGGPERDNLQWENFGVCCHIVTTKYKDSLIPLHEVYNKSQKTLYYSTNLKSEVLAGFDVANPRIVGYVFPTKEDPVLIPLIRWYNGTVKKHYWTTSTTHEADWKANNWQKIGTLGYVYPFNYTQGKKSEPFYEFQWAGNLYCVTGKAKITVDGATQYTAWTSETITARSPEIARKTYLSWYADNPNLNHTEIYEVEVQDGVCD
jgi:hypothetical protein